jgi:flagellar hook-associated protein 3 FlgL
MRVSTLGTFERELGLMQALQDAASRSQEQISTGRRLLTPADDPIAASRTLDLREALSRLDQFDRNSNVATGRLQNEEVALESVNNVLQRVRELALQANNATQSNESRGLIAVEMRENLNQLVQLANSQDGNGRYLFSGNREDTVPVTTNASAYAYNGDQGQRLIQIGANRSVADGDSGAELFFKIRAGNGDFVVNAAAGNTGMGVVGETSVVDPTQYDGVQYTVRFIDSTNYEIVDPSNAVIATGSHQPGGTIAFKGIELTIDNQAQAGDEFVVSPSPYQDVFTSLEQLIAVVDAPVGDAASRAALNNGINNGLSNIDQAIGRVLEVRTQVGSRLASIDNQRDANSGLALSVQQTVGELEDLDYADAISRLTLQLQVLQASQQSFVRTQSLSLFNYL